MSQDAALFSNTQIPLRPLAGTDRAASVLVLGTSSFDTLRSATAVFDRFLAYGGNFFDTAHIYGQTFAPGCCERTLAWIPTSLFSRVS
jgi:aryl-alcohol dehydrogenase-like predicted oxidoreductase